MYTISGFKTSEIRIKGSIFKSYIFSFETLEEMKLIILRLQRKFSDSSHICYAYRWCNCNNLDLFNNPEIIEYSTDDGEPSGTAGKPIVNILKKNSIVNSVIVVVRYFGGTKLGIPGLIKSYKDSADLVIKKVQKKKWYIKKILNIEFKYRYEKLIQSIICQYKGEIIKNTYNENIFLRIEVSMNDFNDIIAQLNEKTQGTINIVK